MLSQPVEAGQHIRRAGEDIVRGEVVLRAGQVLGPPHLGILASLGWKKVPVYKVPTVHILATGDELVPIGALPAEGQIRNSTSVMLEAYVSEAGAEPTALGIATDDKRKLRKKIQEGLNAHVLLITGGVSVGAYDFVGAVLAEIGVDVKFWKVNVKPGKPLLFGVLDDTLVFGLPGNPVSTCITFLRFVRPALYKMMGRVFDTALCFRAIIDHDIHKGDTRRQYLRGIVHQTDKEWHVRTTGSQSSGVLSSMAKANCLIMLPEDTRAVRAGEWVDIELL